MKKLLFLLCAGSLAFLPTGCGQESLSGLDDMGQVGVESSSEGDVGSSSSENLSSSSVTPKLSSSETSVSSSSKKNTSGISHSYGKLLDKRDSTVYKTVTIGGLTWMAENLDYETDYSYCFADLPENCQKYGRLYLWGTAMDSVGEFSNNAKGCGFHSSCKAVEPVRGICPEGWHLPSLKEMTVLFTSAGGRSIAGRVLKSTYDWTLDGNGEDLLGFSVLPAGLRSYENEYMNIGSFSYFWTTDRSNSDFTDIASFQYDSDGAGRIPKRVRSRFVAFRIILQKNLTKSVHLLAGMLTTGSLRIHVMTRHTRPLLSAKRYGWRRTSTTSARRVIAMTTRMKTATSTGVFMTGRWRRKFAPRGGICPIRQNGTLCLIMSAERSMRQQS